jgi:hypothetical protein
MLLHFPKTKLLYKLGTTAKLMSLFQADINFSIFPLKKQTGSYQSSGIGLTIFIAGACVSWRCSRPR